MYKFIATVSEFPRVLNPDIVIQRDICSDVEASRNIEKVVKLAHVELPLQ